MSRKNKAFRAWQHQNPEGSVKDAWDAAWANKFSCAISKKHQEKDARIAELESQLAEREWISVDDRLPEEGLHVLFTTALGAQSIGFHDGERWYLAEPLTPRGPVTMWQRYPALPSPPEGEE